MNHLSKRLLSVTMLLSISQMAATAHSGSSIFLPRAQTGTAHEVLGWSGATHRFDNDDLYGSMKVSSEYNQNFKRDDIGVYLAPTDSSTIVFGAINTAGTTNTTNVYALNFNLEDVTFKSTVKLGGKTQSVVSHVSFFLGLDNVLEGMYATAHAPLIWNRFEPTIDVQGTDTASAATITSGHLVSGTAPAPVYTTVAAAFQGDKTVGDVLTTWSYGRIKGAQSKFGAGDISLTLGYNFINKENAHFGVGIRGSFGAGKASKAEYVFEPLTGHAGRHGIGAVVDGHAVLWDKDEDNQLSIHANANAIHLFANEQKRSFDVLTCGNWSRYLQVVKYTSVSTTTLSVYGGLDNMINIGTRTAKIGIDVAYDASLMLNYHYNNWNIEAGYNLGGHSKEKFEKFTGTPITANTFALRNPAVNLTSAKAAVTTTAAYNTNMIQINGNIVGSTTGEFTTANLPTLALSDANLDTTSVLAPSVMAHTLFGGVNYTFRDTNWAPSIGVFGKAELCGNDNNSLNQWGVGAQFNLSF